MFTAKWTVLPDGGLRAYVVEDDSDKVAAQSVMYPVLGETPSLIITELDKGAYEELLLRLMLFKAKETGLTRYYVTAANADGTFLERFGFKLDETKKVYYASEDTVVLTSACQREENK